MKIFFSNIFRSLAIRARYTPARKRNDRGLSLLVLLFIFTACVPLKFGSDSNYPTPSPIGTFTSQPNVLGLSEEQKTTLNSLARVDDYPLYTMKYVGDYNLESSIYSFDKKSIVRWESKRHSWTCSLFAALGKPDRMLFGRNFDWKYSPALILFTDPPSGNASVSIVDITYLVDDLQDIRELNKLSLDEREILLNAPFLPFDGMNEYGLAIGMAAVPSGQTPPNPIKKRIGSLRVIREILDQAGNVFEAIEIFGQYNIDFAGGPDLHYFIADADGNSAVVEYYQGEINVFYNQEPWQAATNFLIASKGEDLSGNCWRYDSLVQNLNEVSGVLDISGALELLSDVSQSNTQWSVVYGLNTGVVEVVMGRDYRDIHEFRLNLVSR